MDEVTVFIDGDLLEGWSTLNLTRSKKATTGSLSLSIFLTYIPEKPLYAQAVRSAEITVYVGNNLVFVGIVDTRTGTTTGTVRPAVDSSISSTEYSITLQARGKTKYLIDSSHQHDTTNMMQPTTKQVFEKLLEPWQIELDWQAEDIELDKVRFRDGSMVVDEIFRLATENSYFVYETRDGKFRVIDKPPSEFGDDLILGSNILTFSASQSEEKAKAKIKVKGQRSKKELWGKDAILETEIEFEDQWVRSNIPICVQHYGDAAPESLKRRAQFEANRRNSSSKTITIEVFHVQPSTSEAWDVGLLHYVEVPPEGIFNVMECTEVKYDINAQGTLKTTLQLAPPPADATQGVGLSAIVGSVQDLAVAYAQRGDSRAAQKGVSFAPGFYPDVWGPSQLEIVPFVEEVVDVVSALARIADNKQTPPLHLPITFQKNRNRT